MKSIALIAASGSALLLSACGDKSTTQNSDKENQELTNSSSSTPGKTLTSLDQLELSIAFNTAAPHPADKGTYLEFPGDANKPGKNKHIVLLSGDEEYRSEEAMPMLAQILSAQGFKCTVLFSLDKNNKFVDPTNQESLTNSVALDSADAIVMGLRFRKYGEKDMEKFVAAFQRGTPIVALRTSTHPFNFPANSKYAKYAWNAKEATGWKGGFGRHVLGETWVNHHGHHKKEGTRTISAKPSKDASILNGVGTIFAKTDVYGAAPKDPSNILLKGEVTQTLDSKSAAVAGKKNNPMMPVAWTRHYKNASGKTNKIFTTTMGSADDLSDENLRRLVVNAVYWGLDFKVPAKADAALKNKFNPTFYGFGTYQKGLRPADFIDVGSAEPKAEEKAEAAKGKPGIARYIRISLTGDKRTLTLSEVEVISGGGNIALGGKATQSSTHSGAGADRAIDNKAPPTWGSGSQTHTRDGGSKNPWWELDLKKGYNISNVIIWNRNEGSLGQRLNDFTIEVLDSKRKVLFTKKNIKAPKSNLKITFKNGALTYEKAKHASNAGSMATGDFWDIQNLDIKASPADHPAAKPGTPPATLNIAKNSHIAFVGGGLGSRMNKFNEFETELQRRYPQHNLYIRNLCHEGDTPAFRPHPSRNSYYVVPDARQYLNDEYKQGSGKDSGTWGKKGGRGHYETPDQWLARHKVDTVIGFFGYSESFDGIAHIPNYKKELRAFIQHTLKAQYSGKQVQLAIVSPAAFEDLSRTYDLPDGTAINKQLAAYTKAMAEVCKQEGVLFVDAFSITDGLYKKSSDDLTSNGHNLNNAGYKAFAPLLANNLFGSEDAKTDYDKVKKAVTAKNNLWLEDYKIPNGVHVHGRRFRPYGIVNYPTEIRKIREMTHIRDAVIWAVNKGNTVPDKLIAEADSRTIAQVEINTNSNRPNNYKSGKEVEGMLKMAPGFKVQLFADEKMFPNLANPSQMAFDNKGRLWVSCMASYPHYRFGDPAPNDKILIYEDTDGDGVADKESIFVENIHIPMGFEITEKGVFVSLGKDLVLFKDTNGDSKADSKEYVLSGFDDHDTHHAISSFCADPSGAIYMGEGTFLHSNVETPYGTVRGTNGGFYRYNPSKMRLERTAQLGIPNPWGIAFNDWGQNFFLHTSGTAFSWMQQNAVKPRYNVNLSAPQLLTSNAVRPTSGVEFVHSSHFPDEMQGDVIICNNIGYLGAKQHKVEDDPATGFFKTTYRHDLFKAPNSYQYFRPVDLEFAPDGSLYFIDWSNVLIGHMQHNARDPKRDHAHGRIYRVTYPARPLVKPAKIDGASIEQLLENLKLPEYRTRYRTRRELRGHDAGKVFAATQKWVASLDKSDKRYEHHLLEALWVTWGINQIDQDLLEKVLKAKDYRARTAAVRVVRYNADKLSGKAESYLLAAAADEHAQVRHEAVIQASWMGKKAGLAIIAEAEKKPVTRWSQQAYKFAKVAAGANPEPEPVKPKEYAPKHVPKKYADAYIRGKHLYNHGEFCFTCHGADGKGQPGAFPPLDGAKWANSDKELLAKIALHGIQGEIQVKGKKFNIPMPGFAFRSKNKDIADILTYVRNAWSNKNGDGFTEKEIEKLLNDTKDKQKGMYNAKDLLKAHPLK